MKKIIISILAFIYITISSGFTVNMHYCMGELVEYDFLSGNEKSCSNCGMKETESKGCCENKLKILKIDKEHTISDLPYQLPLFSCYALTTAFLEKTHANSYPVIKVSPFSNALLRGQNLPLFIFNRVFRI